MKTIIKLLVINLPFIIILLLPFSCEDKFIESYKASIPVYMSYGELRSSVVEEAPRPLNNPGKIYFKDGYIFINENKEGVHVIDNTDPTDPNNVTFIKIPGNADIAIKGNTLFADSYVDLVAIDITDLHNIKEIGRMENAFPYTIPPFEYGYRTESINEDEGVVVGWKVKKIEKEIKDHGQEYPIDKWYGFSNSLETMAPIRSGASGGANAHGIGGSMARFTISKNILYVLNTQSLKLFDVTSSENILANGEFNIGSGMETVFPYNEHLFIGTQTGMLIYNISEPTNPVYVSSFAHIRSCDPVVVDENYAYVTLRDGNNCGETVNQLDVVNIEDYKQPYLMKSYPMVHPHGLGIEDELLFICDGDAGLKIYNTGDPYKIKDNHLVTFGDIHAYDVIPVNDILLMIGNDGFYQYTYSGQQQISLLSHIPVSKKE